MLLENHQSTLALPAGYNFTDIQPEAQCMPCLHSFEQVLELELESHGAVSGKPTP